MDIIYIIVLSFGSVIALYIFCRLIGYRQMSEMNMFEYINGITVGSIAAEMATALEKDWWLPLTAMIVYTAVCVFISRAVLHSRSFRHLLNGKPIILLHNGHLYDQNMKKAKIDLTQLLVQCRLKGYFDLSEVQTVIFEPNGNCSILPKAAYHPVTANDMNLSLPEDFPVAVVIIDGHILNDNLSHTGKDRQWLIQQMHNQNISSETEVVLGLCDTDNNAVFYRRPEHTPKMDFLS